MGKLLPVSMGRGSKQARQGLAGMTLFQNAYVEDLGEDGKTPFTAQVINGWNQWADLGVTGSILKMLPISDANILAVNGTTLYTVTIGGAIITTVGGIPGTGKVWMASNRKTPDAQVAITRDGTWYIYENGFLTTAPDADLPPPICVVEILGYFVFLIRDGRWFISATNASTIDSTDFAEAESSVDKNVAAAVRGRTLIIFGERTTEFWDVNGNATFPFGFTAALSMGCFAEGSVQNLVISGGQTTVDAVIWAATDRAGAYSGVYMLNGYTPSLISTAAIDRAIRDEPDKTSISSMAWTEDGKPFYAIFGSSFWKCYDGKTQEWHDRISRGLSRWNAQSTVYFDGKTLFGHQSDGKIYESSPTAMGEAGEVIVWRIQPPPIHAFPASFIVNAIYVDMVMGVGINSTTIDDSNPQLLIDYSKDGGISWGAQRQVPLGTTAEAYRRVKARALGRFDHNGLTLRLTCFAKTTRALQQIVIDVDPLAS